MRTAMLILPVYRYSLSYDKIGGFVVLGILRLAFYIISMSLCMNLSHHTAKIIFFPMVRTFAGANHMRLQFFPSVQAKAFMNDDIMSMQSYGIERPSGPYRRVTDRVFYKTQRQITDCKAHTQARQPVIFQSFSKGTQNDFPQTFSGS